MIAWQVFHLMQQWQRLAYQHHGCFSVDREGKDLRAFRFAVRTLATTSHPLIVFPEGEVYHLNDLVTSFRDGTFLIASTAVKRSRRPVACIPCSLKYHYLDDPSESLAAVVKSMEKRLDVSARTSSSLAARIEQLQAEMIALREREYLGDVADGDLAERRSHLADVILNRAAARYQLNDRQRNIPERVKEIRQHLIENGDVAEPAVTKTFEDVHVAVQLYSYRFGYVSEKPTIERLAETVDKLEEDLLGARTATIRGARRGTIRFGEPVMMDQPLNRIDCRAFGEAVRQRIQDLLDSDGRGGGN